MPFWAGTDSGKLRRPGELRRPGGLKTDMARVRGLRPTLFALAAAVGTIVVASAQAQSSGALPYLPAFVQEEAGIGTGMLDTKGITVKSAADEVTFHIGGRLHYDAGAAGLDPALKSPALRTNGEIRRGWFEPSLSFSNGVTLGFQYDFATTTRPINDAALGYKGLEPFNVVFGNFKEPFSLNQLESNNTTLFTERSLLDTFAPGRDFGLLFGTHGERWTLAGGAFGGNVNTGLADNGVAGTARFTYAPILTKDQILHFGVAGSYRASDRNGTPQSFSARPEDNLFATALVSTGTLRGADAVARFGLEAAYELNPFRLEGEYVLTTVSGGGTRDRSFQAGYVEASWVINGHARSYSLVSRYASEYAVFKGLEVGDGQRVSHGGVGVFELAARFSAIDLQSGAVRGGVQRDATVGLNWYPDNNIRFMADYIRAHAEPSAMSVTGRTVDSDIFIGRLQVYW